MKCFKGCGFLLKEVTYYKELAILFQRLDAEHHQLILTDFTS